MAKENLRVAGFPEWLPPEQGLENKIKEIIASQYQKYGYINIETPAVEKNEVLTSKSGNEVSKQIFGVYGLAQKTEDLKEYSLHFDLTVPLARYIIDHEDQLEFPFKRYQIQKVRRGERQQKGRFKEFYQCDVDVIDKDVDIAYDAEVIDVLYKTLQSIFKYFNISHNFVVQMNNRKLFDATFDYLQIDRDKKIAIMRLLDDYYKMTPQEFYCILEELAGDNAKQFMEILSFSIDEPSETTTYSQSITEAINEIKLVYNDLKQREVQVKFDPFIVRGLDYYSGTVFEMFVDNYQKFGTVCAGGRFDNLVKYIREKTQEKGEDFGGVGGSIGLSRLLNRLLEEKLIEAKEPLSDVIIFNLNDSSQKYREEIAKTLRGNNFRVDHYFKSEKIAKQFKYAQSKNIPFGIFAGEKEEAENMVLIRDLNKKESIEVNREDVSDFIRSKQ